MTYFKPNEIIKKLSNNMNNNNLIIDSGYLLRGTNKKK